MKLTPRQSARTRYQQATSQPNRIIYQPAPVITNTPATVW